MRVVSRLNSQALSGKSIKHVLRGKSSYYSFYGRLVYLAWRWKARQTLSEHMNLFPEMVGMNWKHLAEQYRQGVVTPIDAVVTAATGVKKRSRGQRVFLATVKRSRTISNSVKRSRCNSGCSIFCGH